MIPALRPATASMRRTLPGGRAVHLAFGVLLGAWIVLPLIPLVLWFVAGQWRAPDILPGTYSAQGFIELFSPRVQAATATSAALGTSVALVATPLGLLAASAIRRLPRTHSRFVEVVLLTPLAIPPFALVMGANVLLLRIYTPSFSAVVLVLAVTALPYTTFMFRSALASYDDRFEEVARTLGASARQTIAHVRLPLLAAATARAAFLAFLVGWGDYIATLLIGGGQLRTLPLIVGSAAAGSGNEQLTAALSLAVIGPPLVLLAALSAPRLRERIRR